MKGASAPKHICFPRLLGGVRVSTRGHKSLISRGPNQSGVDARIALLLWARGKKIVRKKTGTTTVFERSSRRGQNQSILTFFGSGKGRSDISLSLLSFPGFYRELRARRESEREIPARDPHNEIPTPRIPFFPLFLPSPFFRQEN